MIRIFLNEKSDILGGRWKKGTEVWQGDVLLAGRFTHVWAERMICINPAILLKVFGWWCFCLHTFNTVDPSKFCMPSFCFLIVTLCYDFGLPCWFIWLTNHSIPYCLIILAIFSVLFNVFPITSFIDNCHFMPCSCVCFLNFAANLTLARSQSWPHYQCSECTNTQSLFSLCWGIKIKKQWTKIERRNFFYFSVQ